MASIQSPVHDVQAALLDAAHEFEPTPTPASGRDSEEHGQPASDQDDGDGDEDQNDCEDQDGGDDTDGDGVQNTDGGRGAISEPVRMNHNAGYHSADGTVHRHPRMPLSFGGPTRRVSREPAMRNAAAAAGGGNCGGGCDRNVRRGELAVPCGGARGGASSSHQGAPPRQGRNPRNPSEADDTDPLIWAGGVLTPPMQPAHAPAFGLPPLLADRGGYTHHGAHGSHNGQPLKLMRCTSYCCSLGIDLLALHRHLAEWRDLTCRMHKDGLNAVLHCAEQHRSEGRFGGYEWRGAHSFYFSYGCLVTWGLTESEERERLSMLREGGGRDAENGRAGSGREGSGFLLEPLTEEEVDDFGYVHIENAKSSIAKDVVTLGSYEVLEMLAVSFGLAQSVKLGVFERTVEQTIQETRSIPERMAHDGKIRLKRTAITKRIGQLFVDRASINLHSDILDHPDFFWEDDEWLSLYLRASKYLEIDRRAEVLNKRLDIIKELFDMLASELHQSHSNKLEWIVILLIVVEVFFQIVEIVIFYVDDVTTR